MLKKRRENEEKVKAMESEIANQRAIMEQKEKQKKKKKQEEKLKKSA